MRVAKMLLWWVSTAVTAAVELKFGFKHDFAVFIVDGAGVDVGDMIGDIPNNRAVVAAAEVGAENNPCV